jgi:signal transduction histidine kinase
MHGPPRLHPKRSAKLACASLAWISISTADGRIRLEVGDNGNGFDTAAPYVGSCLQNIRDRIDALEGTVKIQSGPAATCIRGHLPLGDDARVR